MVVQRVPIAAMPELERNTSDRSFVINGGAESELLGRRFIVKSFRWLDQEEL